MVYLKQIKIACIGYILISIVFYITGFLCILNPAVIYTYSRILAEIILIAYGIIKIIGYFSKDLYCLAFQYDFACGVFLIILGIMTLSIRNEKELYMLAGLGVLILLDSLLGAQTSLDARRFGMADWKWIFFFSILSAISGTVTLIGKTMYFAGCGLLAEGAMRHYIVHCTVKTDSDL